MYLNLSQRQEEVRIYFFQLIIQQYFWMIIVFQELELMIHDSYFLSIVDNLIKHNCVFLMDHVILVLF